MNSQKVDSAHKIATRTFAIALCFSLGPSLLPLGIAGLRGKPNVSSSLVRVVKRDLAWKGFPFAMSIALAGGVVLRKVRDTSSNSETSSSTGTFNKLKLRLDTLIESLTPTQRIFLSNIIPSLAAFELIRYGRLWARARSLTKNREVHTVSPTLQLTLLLLARAGDAWAQTIMSHISRNKYRNSPDVDVLSKAEQSRLTTRLDGIVFWLCSSRIMWCFFYEPERLPLAYVSWIQNLANLDIRITKTLRLLRSGEWSYLRGSPEHQDILSRYAKTLGYPSSWGDPVRLPAYGTTANSAWKELGVTTRAGVGGLPCQIIHGNVNTVGCTANTRRRAVTAFVKALGLYLPVHFLPIILTRPSSLLQPRKTLSVLLAACRSASFLSAFVASFWYTVCLTRTLVLARILPFIAHDFWDGPFGCVLAGCMVCGTSINIENRRRRGEISLFVLPKAILACLPKSWYESPRMLTIMIERLVFAISLSTLVTAATQNPDSLRGLSRWVLAFIFGTKIRKQDIKVVTTRKSLEESK